MELPETACPDIAPNLLARVLVEGEESGVPDVTHCRARTMPPGPASAERMDPTRNGPASALQEFEVRIRGHERHTVSNLADDLCIMWAIGMGY